MENLTMEKRADLISRVNELVKHGVLRKKIAIKMVKAWDEPDDPFEETISAEEYIEALENTDIYPHRW